LLAANPGQVPAPVDPATEIERALTIAQDKLAGLQVVTRFDHQGELRVPAGYLTQIALTLVANAADAVAGRPNARVLVTTSSAGAAFQFAIEDNGPGIAADILPRIFEPFFSTRGAGKGIGLGLTICAALVKRLGGNSQVVSHVGKGCRHVVTLPKQLPAGEFTRSRVEAAGTR
jgi:two-component system C4-dicarboxylate transport sensor histidine kinase DctB